MSEQAWSPQPAYTPEGLFQWIISPSVGYLQSQGLRG